MELEAAALTRAAAAGAPVPHVLVADDSAAALGNPYLVCDFIGGETIVRRIHARSTTRRGPACVAQCADALAAIHRADPAGIGLDVVGPARRVARPTRRDGRHHGDIRVGVPVARPPTGHRVAEGVGARRLPDGQPDHRHRRCARTARRGARLGTDPCRRGRTRTWRWFCIRAWRFGAPQTLARAASGSVEDFLRAYEEASGIAVDRAAMHWWLVLSTLRWGVICRYQAERHLSGQTRSVELAAIGRRVCETELDLLTLSGGDASDRALHGRPTAAELVAAVAEFLETDVRAGTTARSTSTPASPPTCCARSSANCSTTRRPHRWPRSASPTKRALAAAIRAASSTTAAPRSLACLRTLVLHRLAVAHPGYEARIAVLSVAPGPRQPGGLVERGSHGLRRGPRSAASPTTPR